MNVDFKKILILLIGLLFATHVQGADILFFTQNLRLGDRNYDVRALQVFLNKNFDTRIAVSGIGSSGNESDFFGGLTRLAVMRFQAKYREEILDPAGLSSPTGFVGPATIKKINSLLESAQTNTNTDISVVQNSVDPSLGMPIISHTSKVTVSAGDNVAIYGKFSGTSVVHLGDAIVSSKSVSATEINFTVSQGSGVSIVWVSNEYGDSRADFPVLVSLGKVESDILSKIVEQNTVIYNKAVDPANQ